MAAHTFKLGIFLNELQLPLDEGLEEANELGVEFVWFSQLPGKPLIADLSDAEADDVQRRIEAAGLEHMKVSAGSPFKFLDLTEVTVDTLEDHEEFKADFRAMVRSMELANRFGVGAVSVYSFAWPGEYTADKPTWPMRWMTRGGIISDVEMDKLVKAYTLMVEQAEKHNVDLVLSMMPWNYTNTTGNFRQVAERIGSDRIKAMWGAADNFNCGESDVSTRGFVNIEPYVFGTHVKDLRVNDGVKLDFDYLPFGEGDIDYRTLFRNVRDSGLDPYVSISTHWTPESGDRVEAMRTQVKNVKALLDTLDD